MRLRWTLAALVAADSALCFKDASPFFSWSSARYQLDGNDRSREYSIATKHSVESLLREQLTHCSSTHYIFINQEGGTTEDYETHGQSDTPHLSRWLGKDGAEDRIVAAGVIGQVDGAALAKETAELCAVEVVRVEQPALPTTQSSKSAVFSIKLAPLPQHAAAARAAALTKNDAYLASILEQMGPTDDWTVIYTTSPSAAEMPHHGREHDERHQPSRGGHSKQEPAQLLDADSEDAAAYPDAPPHAQHYKRDTSAHPRYHRRADNGTVAKGKSVALFEKYEFFSPAIFMGGLVALLLVAISFVGVSAIAGLEVSYKAFDKEMGPAGQKKAQ